MTDLDQALFGFLNNPPASIDELLARITPELYERLKEAVALGRWSEAERMQPEQIEQCMQLIILYEAQHLEDSKRVGAPLQSDCNVDSRGQAGIEEAQPITLMTDGQNQTH